MLSDLPFWTVVAQVVRHTPLYAWAILATLVVLGLAQWRDHTVTRARLALAPIGLGAFSLWGTTMAFGAQPIVVAAWLAGIALALAGNRWLRWPRDVRPTADGRFALRASPWPLIAMMTVFSLRYAVSVTLVFHRDWAAHTGFSLPIALTYGVLSGLFAARARDFLPGRAGAAQQAHCADPGGCGVALPAVWGFRDRPGEELRACAGRARGAKGRFASRPDDHETARR